MSLPPVQHTGTVPNPDAVLSTVRERLTAAGCVAAEEEARALVDAAPDGDALEGWLVRREDGEPLAWLVGTVRFCGRTLHVDPGVYVPRPQSEELARRAAELLPGGGRAIDLCTGAGAVAAHLAATVPTAAVVGVDLDPRAVSCARRNRVDALVADLGAALRPRCADVVTAVAPYVPTDRLRLLPIDVQRYEPRLGLDGGPDGLDLVRRVVEHASRLLRRSGHLLVEVGGDQHGALDPTLRSCGFAAVTPWFDQDGDLRGIVARSARPGSED